VRVHVVGFELYAGGGGGDEAAIRTLIRSFRGVRARGADYFPWG
jgi:hypothetical protein